MLVFIIFIVLAIVFVLMAVSFVHMDEKKRCALLDSVVIVRHFTFDLYVWAILLSL